MVEGVKNRSSKRAKDLAISRTVKETVMERDGGCVWCRLTGIRTGLPAYPEAHYIPRSKGGLGVEENILTLCRPHHDLFDRGTREQREMMRRAFRAYLQSTYPEWDESKLTYTKETR